MAVHYAPTIPYCISRGWVVFACLRALPAQAPLATTGAALTGCLAAMRGRQLSHQSFRCAKPLEYFLAYCGVLAFEGAPLYGLRHRGFKTLKSCP